jgi:hypothetical protein
MSLRIIGVLSGILLSGCLMDGQEDLAQGGSGQPQIDPSERSAVVRAAIEGNGDDLPLYAKYPLEQQEKGETELMPPPLERTRIRMTIDQLEANVLKVTDGVLWLNPAGKNNWELKRSAFGVPDYMVSVLEIREPTLLFDKLVGDAARDICPVLLQNELANAPEERVFLTDVQPDATYESAPGAVESNISRLVLRYHGRYLPPGDSRLSPWVTLFAEGSNLTNDSIATWTAVCVALLTHPDFTSY